VSDRETSFVPVQNAAARLGLPVSWLKAEADARRIPHVRIGRRILFNVEAVEQALLSRASRFLKSSEGVAHAN
jgi:excisionase family DNA binding protein